MLGTLLVAGCGGERDGTAPVGDRAAERQPEGQGGRVVDLTASLSPAEKAALERRLSGREATVVILRAAQGQSLEQVGWAVGGARVQGRSVLILVDPATRQVRIEGNLPVEAKAAVAAAMQEELGAGRIAAAIDRGLARLPERGA